MKKTTHITTAEHARMTVIVDDEAVHVYSEYRTSLDRTWFTDQDAGISFDRRHLTEFMAALQPGEGPKT